MDIRTSSPSNNFKAVRISPAPNEWNQKVLNSVLKSNFVRDIVKEDAKNERDTFISFAEHFDPAYPDYTRYNHMFFNITGNNKDITLGSHSTYRYESAQFLKRAKEIKTGPDDLGSDLAEQISNLDTPELKNKKEPIINQTLNGLKRLAGGMVIEKPRDYEKFRT